VKASCVIKVGGSLLDYPELPSRLASYLADLGRPNPVLLCGGGPTVDAIRKIDRAHGMDEEASHWIAVRALALNARLLEAIVPNLVYTERAKDLPRAWKSRKVPLLDPFIFLSEVDESFGDPLPRRWRVTSDSIAARMAARLEAPELVLLKSAEIPGELTVPDAAEEGIVDAQFPLAARDLDRIVLVSFRGEEIRETILEKEAP
jgi:5-(aminomethyl)-3-furanmethanol phosphate kinase